MLMPSTTAVVFQTTGVYALAVLVSDLALLTYGAGAGAAATAPIAARIVTVEKESIVDNCITESESTRIQAGGTSYLYTHEMSGLLAREASSGSVSCISLIHNEKIALVLEDENRALHVTREYFGEAGHQKRIRLLGRPAKHPNIFVLKLHGGGGLTRMLGTINTE